MAASLVIQAARFGDLVQTKRLLRTLAARGEVHLAVDDSLLPLARRLYPFAEPHGLAVHGAPCAAGAAANRAVLARWRALRPGQVFNVNYSPLTAALCRVFPPEAVRGYRPAPGGVVRSPWARLGFRLSERRPLATLNLADFWANFTAGPLPPEGVNPPARPGGRGLGVALAGREARRSLPPPLLAEVTRTVCAVLRPRRIYLLGTATERPAARRLLRRLPPALLPAVEDLCGKTDWPALADALSGLDALITPDTGLMHLAAHLGVPVLAFFLSSAWLHETGPYGLGHHVWQASCGCAPCLESAPCPRGTACAAPLGGPELLRSVAAVAETLKNGGAPTRPLPPLPGGLQLWATDFDALGARPRLLAGEDAHAEKRRAVRAFLAARLGLPRHEDTPAPAPLREWLWQDEDWMLPPGRYC